MKELTQHVGILLLLAAIALGGSACPQQVAEKTAEQAVERMIEQSTGGEVDVDASGERMTLTDKETGETTEVSATGELPEGWPAEIPMYPNSKIIFSQRSELEGEYVLHVVISTPDATTQVVEFLQTKAESAGFIREQATQAEGEGSVSYVKPDQRFFFAYATTPDGTEVSMQVLPNQGEMPEHGTSTTMGTGALPEGFPEDFLPVYPGAEVLQATVTDNDALLTIGVGDSTEQVLQFYQEYWTSRGWQMSVEVAGTQRSAASFESDGNTINLSISHEDEQTTASMVYSKAS